MDRVDTVSQPRLLGRFGVNSEAETVWRLLIGNPTLTRQNLARLAGLTADGTETAIQDLLRARLAQRSQSPPHITLIDPALALESNVGGAERQLTEALEELAEVRAHIPDLAKEYARGRRRTSGSAGIEIIVGIDEVRRQIYLSAEGCVTECLNLHHMTTAEGIRDASASDSSLAARGVRNRSIFDARSLQIPEIYTELRVSHARGELYRTVADVPTRMLIHDHSLAVVAVDPSDLHSGAMFLRERSIVDLLVMLFDRMWDAADPLFVDAPGNRAPTDRAARVLELMSVGATDDGIARALGVGVRTIRREVAFLKASFGVTSRAEVSLAAARRGLI